jgi:hypothetical protein
MQFGWGIEKPSLGWPGGRNLVLTRLFVAAI